MNTVITLLFIGLAAGILSGFLGIGGGIIIVPSLVYFLGMNQHAAQGTSLVMFLMPIGILGAYNYYKGEQMDVKYAVIMALTFIAGSYIGSKISLQIDQATLKKTFGILMLVVGIKLLIDK